MQHTNYPCWLTPSQLEQADALLNFGFEYLGNEDDEDWCNTFICYTGDWAFYSTCGEVCLEAVCNGAVYVLNFETVPEIPVNEFDARVKEAKTAIREVVKFQKARANAEAEQLSLFG